MAMLREATRQSELEDAARRILVVSSEHDLAAVAFAREIVGRMRAAHHLATHGVAERTRTEACDFDAIVLGGSADPAAGRALAAFVARSRRYLAGRTTACFLIGPWPREQDAVSALDAYLARGSWRPELGVAFPALSSRYGILVRWSAVGRGEPPLAFASLSDVDRFARAVTASTQRVAVSARAAR